MGGRGRGQDPARVVGRLREREADANVRLDQFGDADALYPPFPCMDELLYHVDGSEGVLSCPLLFLIQVSTTSTNFGLQILCYVARKMAISQSPYLPNKAPAN